MREPCLACSRCCYCDLPVLTDDNLGHPGHGIVEQLLPGRGLPGEAVHGIPELRLVHRFCARALGSRSHRHALRCGVPARRARLGRATERYETATGTPATHDRLGLAVEAPSGTPWSVTWRIRKMRYAALAARRYYGAGAQDHYWRVR
jgi:hypothetical protein